MVRELVRELGTRAWPSPHMKLTITPARAVSARYQIQLRGQIPGQHEPSHN